MCCERAGNRKKSNVSFLAENTVSSLEESKGTWSVSFMFIHIIKLVIQKIV